MTTTKTTIERADEIVGIADDIRVNEITRAFDDNIYRRGAYMTWLAAPERQRNTMASYGAMFANAIGSSALFIPNGLIAELIIAVHAASKPKGDGLPEVTEVHTWTSYSGGGKEFSFSFGPPVTDDKSATAMHDYIARCLSSATRRFLAAFECFDPTSDEKCSGEAFVVTTTTAACVAGPNGPVCWLKPRETK